MSSKEVGHEDERSCEKTSFTDCQFKDNRYISGKTNKVMMIKDTKTPSESQEKTLEKQFRSQNNQKKFSRSLAGQLFYLSDEERLYNPHTEDAMLMKKQYQVAMNCSNHLTGRMNGDKVVFHGKRCKCRICSTCLRARTAKLINAYEEPLSQIDDLHFVTLTAPTVTTEELPNRMEEFSQLWGKIAKSMYWRRNKPSGMRKVECTLRPNDHYHYHFHILIGGKENAEWLINKWLELSPTSKKSAQDMRKVRKGDKGAIKEIFKYFTKFISKDGSEVKIDGNAVAYGLKKRYYVDIPRLDYVMFCMRGKRVFQPFGSIRAVNEDDFEVGENLGLPLEYYRREFKWHKEKGYIDCVTKEQLVPGYKAPSWIDILVGDVDEDLLNKRVREFKRDIVKGLYYQCGKKRSRKVRYRKQEYYDGDVDFTNFDGWGVIKSEVATEPQSQEPEPPKQEREDLEAPPLYEPMGITDRRISGCRCVSAERQSKGIEIYLDM